MLSCSEIRFAAVNRFLGLACAFCVGLALASAPAQLAAAERATVHFDNPDVDPKKTSGVLVSVNENEVVVKPFLKHRKLAAPQTYVLDRASIISGPEGFCNWDDLPDPSKKNYVARMEWLPIPGAKRLTVLAVSPYNEEEVEDFNIMQPLPDEGEPASLEELE